MFKRILIANRGEIACRIIKTARRMGIETVAVYSAADKDALHVEMADMAVPIGPPAAAESYLAIEKIVEPRRDRRHGRQDRKQEGGRQGPGVDRARPSWRHRRRQAGGQDRRRDRLSG